MHNSGNKEDFQNSLDTLQKNYKIKVFWDEIPAMAAPATAVILIHKQNNRLELLWSMTRRMDFPGKVSEWMNRKFGRI